MNMAHRRPSRPGWESAQARLIFRVGGVRRIAGWRRAWDYRASVEESGCDLLQPSALFLNHVVEFRGQSVHGTRRWLHSLGTMPWALRRGSSRYADPKRIAVTASLRTQPLAPNLALSSGSSRARFVALVDGAQLGGCWLYSTSDARHAGRLVLLPEGSSNSASGEQLSAR